MQETVVRYAKNKNIYRGKIGTNAKDLLNYY